jgi:hypothetical protein
MIQLEVEGRVLAVPVKSSLHWSVQPAGVGTAPCAGDATRAAMRTTVAVTAVAAAPSRLRGRRRRGDGVVRSVVLTVEHLLPVDGGCGF